jgi:hypothetical protein
MASIAEKALATWFFLPISELYMPIPKISSTAMIIAAIIIMIRVKRLINI